jgi:hypothetical protein
MSLHQLLNFSPSYCFYNPPFRNPVGASCFAVKQLVAEMGLVFKLKPLTWNVFSAGMGEEADEKNINVGRIWFFGKV